MDIVYNVSIFHNVKSGILLRLSANISATICYYLLLTLVQNINGNLLVITLYWYGTTTTTTTTTTISI